MTLLLLLWIPLGAAGLVALVPTRKSIEAVHLLGSAGTLGAGAGVAAQVWSGGSPAQPVVPGFALLAPWLRADALSALMALVITLTGAIAGLYAVGYMRAESRENPLPRARVFFALFHLFIFTMLLAVTTDNLGIMWVTIEGTTLATVFLVNLHNTRTSLEAAYKYLILSSVGIALAFIGTVLMYYAGAPRAGEIAVNWTSLRSAAGTLNPGVVRLAFIFVLVGYGTKAGLAPMHTWLPDAHSEAPAPISALMSGVLLNVGLYALVRFKAVVDITLGPGFSSRCLLALGLLSITLAAAFLLRQRNFKRMLAYSSVEHIGIISLGLGFGGYWGVLGSLLHVVNHSLAKSLLFIVSGDIGLKYGTTEIRKVRGLLRASPLTGGLFLAGTLALIGLPPFAPFISEFIILRAGLESGAPWVAAAALALLVVVFAGMLRSVNGMLYGALPDGVQRGCVTGWFLAPVGINFALLALLGLALPPSYLGFLNQVVALLGT